MKRYAIRIRPGEYSPGPNWRWRESLWASVECGDQPICTIPLRLQDWAHEYYQRLQEKFRGKH